MDFTGKKVELCPKQSPTMFTWDPSKVTDKSETYIGTATAQEHDLKKDTQMGTETKMEQLSRQKQIHSNQ